MKFPSLLGLLLIHTAPVAFAHDDNNDRLKAVQPSAEQSISQHVSRKLSLPTIFCLLEIDVPLFGTCLCRESELIRAFEQSNPATTTDITICAGTITLLSGPIDIEGKNVKIGCSTSFFYTCDLSGGRRNRIFQGAPKLLSLMGIRMKNGSADKSEVDAGGALFLTGGMTTLSDVAFVDNEAGAGGAIYVGPDAKLMVTSAQFLGNDATKRAFGGGAIHVDGGVVSMEKGMFNGNTARGFGGAINGQDAEITMQKVEFTDNTAGEGGGAIAANSTTVELIGTVFSEYSVRDGSAIYIRDDGNVTFVKCDTVQKVSFCSGFEEGAIFEEEDGMVNNTDCGIDTTLDEESDGTGCRTIIII